MRGKKKYIELIEYIHWRTVIRALGFMDSSIVFTRHGIPLSRYAAPAKFVLNIFRERLTLLPRYHRYTSTTRVVPTLPPVCRDRKETFRTCKRRRDRSVKSCAKLWTPRPNPASARKRVAKIKTITRNGRGHVHQVINIAVWYHLVFTDIKTFVLILLSFCVRTYQCSVRLHSCS